MMRHDDDGQEGMSPVRSLSKLQVAALVFVVALLLGLLEAAQIYVGAALEGHPVTFGWALLTLTTWAVLAVLTLPAIAAALRWRLDQGRWRRHLPLHVLGGLTFALAHLALSAGAVGVASGGRGQVSPLLFTMIRLFFALDVVTYGAIVGGVQAYAYRKEARERELTAMRLRERLTEARFQALRSQVDPHFLFNTLNAISTLALRGKRESVVATIGRLSELLRRSLDAGQTPEVSLANELELLEMYLDIVRIRMGDRLTLEREVDPATLELKVPSFVLQPLVENAVLHGIGRKPGPGRIRIVAAIEDGFLRLAIHDTGPGFEGSAPTDGLGLANTRARIRAICGEAGRLDLAHSPHEGTVATLWLPRSFTIVDHDGSTGLRVP